MGIKNNVAYTEGTVEQLGENVYFGTSNVQPSLWDNINGGKSIYSDLINIASIPFSD